MPDNTQKGAPAAAAKRRISAKRRRAMRVRVAILSFILIAIIAAVIAVVLLLIGPGKAAAGSEQKRAVFGVNEITVEGTERYTAEQVIEKSGFYIGQSVLSVNKKRAVENIKTDLHYVRQAVVDSPSFGHLRIRIYEEIPIAVVRMTDDAWMVLAETGRGVEKMTGEQAVQSGLLRVLTGALAEQQGQLSSDGDVSEEAAEVPAGKILLPDRQFDALSVMLAGFKQQGIDGVLQIDMTNMIDIRLNWKDRIEVLIGNDAKLEDVIPVFSSSLSWVLENRGADIRGRLDLSSISLGTGNNDHLYFTPESAMPDAADEEKEPEG